MHWHPGPTDPIAWIAMTLGQLDGRSEEMLRRLSSIDGRLKEGDQRMNDLGESIKKLEQAHEKTTIGAIERWIKEGLRFLIPLGVLWATGSIEAASRVLGLFK